MALAMLLHAYAHETIAVCGSNSVGACGTMLLQQSSSKGRVVGAIEAMGDSSLMDDICDESTWPDKDHNLVCGDCKVLVDRFDSFYRTCKSYCSKVGRSCAAAWEEQADDCNVKHEMRCDETIFSSDAICQCGDELSSGGMPDSDEVGCYGEFVHRATDEGGGIGVPEMSVQSDGACKEACDGNLGCRSFTYCPEWGKCWLKDRGFSGDETTTEVGTCKTYFKKPCDGEQESIVPSVPSTQAPLSSSSATVKVVSYNLYWWNAFDQSAWKSDHIVNNIEHKLQADTLGLQECDSASTINERTGYVAASPFKGAQGVMVRPGVFRVESSGFQDIEATGKWGPRYVTWAQLTHLPTGRSFWHFNTHWCVHSGNGHTCSSEKRYTGAKNMLAAIREKAGSAPVVITGDFNANMNEPGPRHFTQNGFALAKSSWVDAIFYSESHWRVVSTATGDADHSDHRPVIAELQLK